MKHLELYIVVHCQILVEGPTKYCVEIVVCGELWFRFYGALHEIKM